MAKEAANGKRDHGQVLKSTQPLKSNPLLKSTQPLMSTPFVKWTPPLATRAFGFLCPAAE